MEYNSSKQQSIFKKANKEAEYAQIDNKLINNRSLSYKALGILIYILSKPNDWEVYISDLIRENDKEKSVRSGINELIENNYMQRYRVYDKDTGKVTHWETLVSETPFSNEEKISHVKEEYLRDEEGKIRLHTIKFGNKERTTPIVISREVILLSQKVEVENLQIEKEGLQIKNNTNKKNINKNLKVSSSSQKVFEENICPLRKITKIKFINLIASYDEEMVNAVIEECVASNVHSYNGFEAAFKSYVDRGCKTRSEVEEAAATFRVKREEKKIEIKKTSKKKNNFTDYEGQTIYSDEYLKNLEKRLLGWEEKEYKYDPNKPY